MRWPQRAIPARAPRRRGARGHSPPPAAAAALGPSAAGRSPFKRGRSGRAFRGVTLHRRTKRWESHIWVRETGKQLYLGGFDFERAAAEAHDLCALKLRGRAARAQLPARDVRARSAALGAMSHEQVVAAVRAGRLTARGASRREYARTTPREVNEKVLPATPGGSCRANLRETAHSLAPRRRFAVGA